MAAVANIPEGPKGQSRAYVRIPPSTLVMINATASAEYQQFVSIVSQGGGTIKGQFKGYGRDRMPLLTDEGRKYMKIEPEPKERKIELNFMNRKPDIDWQEVSVMQGPTTADNNRVVVQTIGIEDGEDCNYTDTVVTMFFFPA